jgi:hypothetical protein
MRVARICLSFRVACRLLRTEDRKSLFSDLEAILGNSMSGLINTCRGQVAALYAVILVTLVGAIALGSDVALMYVNWQHMQKVADAAALAGANYLAGYTFSGTAASGCGSEPDAAKTAACTYAANNGLAAASLTMNEPTGRRCPFRCWN